MTYFALATSLIFAALRPSSGPLWSRGPTWLLTIKTVEDKVSTQQKNIDILAFTVWIFECVWIIVSGEYVIQGQCGWQVVSATGCHSLTIEDGQMLDHKWLKNMSAGGWKYQTSECKGGNTWANIQGITIPSTDARYIQYEPSCLCDNLWPRAMPWLTRLRLHF